MTPSFLVVDKPVGLTSHDVVGIVRATTGIRRVGHTGTLDPFATGVLPLAIGRTTRLIQFLDEDLKVYETTIRLGQATDTGDWTGQVVREMAVPEINEDSLRKILEGRQGEQMQTPPQYSAVKVNGKRAYEYARAGEFVELKPRPIRIDQISLLDCQSQRLTIRIQCGRGTYVRVLGEEIAQDLGTVGHLETLRRIQSGPFREQDAIGLDSYAALVSGQSSEDWRRILRPARGEERVPWCSRADVLQGLRPNLISAGAAFSHLPILDIPAPFVVRFLQNGQLRGLKTDFAQGIRFRACHDGELLALMEQRSSGPRALKMVVGLDEWAAR